MSTLSPIQLLPALPVTAQSASRPEVQPIIDLRPGLGWGTKLPVRLLTIGLWGVGFYLTAVPVSQLPGNLAAVAAFSGVSSLPLMGFVALRNRRTTRGIDAGQGNKGAGLPAGSPIRCDPLRQELAASAGIDEASLFRGRHARICTVHHNSAGDLVAIQASQPMMGRRLPNRDAHPVG